MPSRHAAWVGLALLAACDPVEPGPVATHVEDWRDQIVYQIVVDRFDNGDPSNDVVDGIGPEPGQLERFQGGDWRGVRDRLDYLEALGVTAIWLSPPYRNVPRTEREDGYHGYWPADFTEANPRFGSLGELRALVDAAHARDMLVILDVVPNHAGRVFTYDLDADGVVDEGEVEPPWADPPYEAPLLWTHRPRLWTRGPDGMRARWTLEAEHFHRHGFGDLSMPRQKELGDFPTGLRDLDTEREAVIEALVETHAWWVEQTDVDGFRLDAVPHAGRVFWAAFCGRLRARLAALGKERFFLLGEVFTGSAEVLASYTQLDQLDAAFAFDLKVDLIDGVILEGRPPAIARGALRDHAALFPASPQPNGIGLDPWAARVVFADNHDVWRLRGELDDPLAAQIAMTVVFTVDGIPAVYYGTEQGLDGRFHHASREPLWEAGFDRSHPTFRHIARLAALRRDSAALRRGSLTVRYASESGGADEDPAEDAGMLAYERALDDERILVVLNASLDESRATFRTGFAEGTHLFDALEATDAPWVVGDGGALGIRLPGRSAVVLR
ncbi:MAG TPA: alpha-amylase family glycosyl hydrolase [Sandaracinaceae bacterium LLY-WYZ-13_1]|nr:alpha-amylase family glycosyl hydrolase [Sandaracinaceae bacterium LLY-WYZ-13_1]